MTDSRLSSEAKGSEAKDSRCSKVSSD